MNLYKYYIYNIYILLNYYNFEYYWFNINDYLFYEGVKENPSYIFSQYNNPWLDKYIKNPKGLGEEILKNGTFTPIFFQEVNNKKYVIIGKHRLYSLLLNNQKKKINKKFLFIKLPEKNKNININKEFIVVDNKQQIKLIIPKTLEDIFNILIKSGDNLTNYLWENKSQPFLPFNNQTKFKQWI